MTHAATVEDLGKAIRAARREAGLTQAQVAEAAKVSRAFVITLEAGTGPRAEVGRVLAVVRALGLTISLERAAGPSYTETLELLLGS